MIWNRYGEPPPPGSIAGFIEASTFCELTALLTLRGRWMILRVWMTKNAQPLKAECSPSRYRPSADAETERAMSLLLDFTEAVDDPGAPDVGGGDILKMQFDTAVSHVADAAMTSSDARVIVLTTLPLSNDRCPIAKGTLRLAI
jgi:hypothetical protein